MKVFELIKELEQIEDQKRRVTVLLGNEDEDVQEWEDLELHHVDGNRGTVVEIFIYDNNK